MQNPNSRRAEAAQCGLRYRCGVTEFGIYSGIRTGLQSAIVCYDIHTDWADSSKYVV